MNPLQIFSSDKAIKIIKKKINIVNGLFENPVKIIENSVSLRQMKANSIKITKSIHQLKTSEYFDEYKLIVQTVKYIIKIFKIHETNYDLISSNKNLMNLEIPHNFIEFCKKVYYWMPSLRDQLEEISNHIDFFEIAQSTKLNYPNTNYVHDYVHDNDNDYNCETNSDSDYDSNADADLDLDLHTDLNMDMNIIDGHMEFTMCGLMFDENGIDENIQQFKKVCDNFKLLSDLINQNIERYDKIALINKFENCENIYCDFVKLKNTKEEIKKKIKFHREQLET